MLIDKEVYLEHVGVKGMRWGVRKNSDAKATKKDNRNRNFKIAAATVSAGAIFVTAFLIKKGRTKVYDYGYEYPTTDIGPMGLEEKRFGPMGLE